MTFPTRWLGPTGALAAGLAVLAASTSGLADRLDLPARDLELRALPAVPSRHVAAVVIDDASLAALGPWPWPRERLALLVARLREAGARAVVLDLLLPEPRDGDLDLARSLAAGPSALAAAHTGGPRAWLLPAPALRGATELGHVNFELDHDGVMRRLLTTKQGDGLSLPALAVAAAKLGGWARPLPIARVLRPDFRIRADAVPAASASAVLGGQLPPGQVRGRVVFVGASASGLGDRVVTPTSTARVPEPGVLVHAAVAEAVLQDRVLARLPPWLAAAAAFLLVMAFARLPRLRPKAHVTTTLALLAATPAASFLLLAATGLEIPLVTLTLVGITALAVVEAAAARRGARDARRAAGILVGELAHTGQPAALASAPEEDELTHLAATLARRRAEETEARRVMAHELKTPLTSIRGFTQMLTDLPLTDAERSRVAALASAEAIRLQEMVERLLELERLGLRDFDREATVVDIAALARRRCEALAAGSGREIAYQGADCLMIRGVESLLERALDNLLANAIKFSPAGSPVTVRGSSRGPDVVLEVEDRGPGIPAAERDAVFARFARGRAARAIPGLGLGLALVAEVVTWHHGRVVVGDGQRGGAVFRIQLPGAPDEPLSVCDDGKNPGRR